MPIDKYFEILAVFGLAEQEASFVCALRATDAYIGGSTALSWFMDDDILPDQDLDIFFTPSAHAPTDITLTLFGNLFRVAGYTRRGNSTGGYRLAKALHIDFVANWYHPHLGRKIQLVVRSADAPADTSAYSEADFDICQFYAKYDPGIGYPVVVHDSPEAAADIRARRVMRIGNLKGQNIANSLHRLSKYYTRGFAFEDEHVSPCSCACGHEHTVKKIQRLTYREAAAVVQAAHACANRVRYFTAPLEPPLARANATPTRPIIQRPPPLEIPPFLEITDALETPPRPKRILPLRKCRKDDSWIVEKPE
jgi:hypothetical protein